MINRENTSVFYNGQHFSRRLIGYWTRPKRISRQEAKTYWNWITEHATMLRWRGNCTGSLQWKPLAKQVNGMQKLPSIEDALRGNCRQNCQHGNLNTTLARRKHSYSMGLEFLDLLGNDHLLAKWVWTAHPTSNKRLQKPD
jgi:hypothetical protein